MSTDAPTFTRRAGAALLLVLAAMTIGSAPAKSASVHASVINGTAVSQATYDLKYPFQVALFAADDSNSFLCGGTLIAPRWVLTAAHCMDESAQVQPTYAMIGRANQDDTSRGEVIPVEYNAQYPKWTSRNRTGLYDLMLVRLQRAPANPITVPLATKADDPKSGRTATVIGWGLTNSRAAAPPTNLRRATLTIKSQISCSHQWHGSIYKAMVCAAKQSRPARGVCSGDSGGPLLYKGMQIGIVSFGTSGCRSTPPNVFTRVSSYRDEIFATIAANP